MCYFASNLYDAFQKMRRLSFIFFLIIAVFANNHLFAAAPLDSNSIVFQAFYWNVPEGGIWYDTIRSKASELKSAGFTHFWFPPPTKGAGGGYSMGYDLYDNYDLGNYYQKGTVETRFGSLSELQDAAAACGNVLLTLVANHMMGAEAQCQDPTDGKWYWQRFEYVHSNFWKDCTCFHPGAPDDCDLCNGNDYLMGEDVCHNNPYMFNGQRDWASWMKTTVGNVSGFQLDAVKHYSWDMAKEFGTIGSCIGEYWDNKENILNWIAYTGNYALDYPLYYAMQGNAADLDAAGLCSDKGVSFVGNHDTDDISQKSRAYGFIMYITPIPCVFWPHWFDSSLYPDIRRALEARTSHDFSGTWTIYKTTHFIVFRNNGQVYGCFNSADTTGSATITATPNTTYRAIAWGPGSRPANVTSDGSGQVTLSAPAAGYTYWYGGNIGKKAAVPDPVNGATEVSPDIVLSWIPGDGAVSHNVYFGTTSPGDFQGNQTGTTFDPGTLDGNTTYYWRIDEVDAEDNVTVGNVWSFTTGRLYQSEYDKVHVMGNSSRVFGGWWDPNNPISKMTLVADYTWRWERKVHNPTNVEYKFAMNGSADINRCLGNTSGPDLPQNNWNLRQDGANIAANLPAAICVWEYHEDTETSRLYVNVDFDIDGDVDFTDFTIFSRHWLSQNCTKPNWCDGTDLNKSSSVDLVDLAIFVEYWLLDTSQ